MKAVVFDMDGILFDTERISCECWKETGEEMGLGDISEGVTGCIGLNKNDATALIHRLYGEDFPWEEFRARAHARMDRRIAREGLPVKTGVREILEYLEKQGRGLNLTWEVIDGIRNNKTNGRPATLEGEIVRLSDKIAYINHDIDDVVRGGILKEEDIPQEYREVLGVSTRIRLDTMVHNVITNSMDCPAIRMSPDVAQAMAGLRRFMF